MTSVFDLHVHTNRGSPDSALTPEELVSEAHRLRLTGVMVTEHDGWPRYDFEAFARDQDLVLVRALEVYTPLGHVITLGLDAHVVGYGEDLGTIYRLRDEVDRVGGFMILAHPFRFLFDLPTYTQNMLFRDAAKTPRTAEEASEHPVFKLVDEIEVVNGGNIERENRFAQEVAALLGRWGTGGSDAHSTDGFAKGVTVFNGDIRHEADLLEALRAGDFFPVEGFHVGTPNSYGLTSWLTPWMLDVRGHEDANH
ncbi:PHP domain-containing protein [Dehalococcoidia bacterium]|nr:PHP domain-containing protein [Dehalococcoidia bacterium]